MSQFSKNIASYVTAEIAVSQSLQQPGQHTLAFTHLENAHVLGQESTYWHVKVHILMLIWAIEQKDFPELFDQLVRILGEQH